MSALRTKTIGARLRKAIVTGVLAFWAGWQKFWFESNGPARMRLFRGSYGWFLVLLHLTRTPDLELYFSESGILPLAQINGLLPMDYRHSILYHVTSVGALWAWHGIFLASLVALALGLAPRLAAAVAFVLHVSFMHRNMSPMYGVDMISSFYLLYLTFASYRTSRVAAGGVSDWLGSVSIRLMQIQVCIIYAYAGLDKVRGPQWWAGEALWGVVSNPQLARWDFTWFAHMPLVLVFMTYSTLLWEIYFPVLIWFKRLRAPLMLFGVAMHVGIGLVVNIPFFGGLMMLMYILFIEEEQAERVMRWFRPAFLFRSARAARV